MKQNSHEDLTPREQQVLDLLLQGLNRKQVASRLGKAESTVRIQITAIYTKFGVHSRGELFVYALRHGLLKKEEVGA